MSSEHRDWRTIRFLFHLNNQTCLRRWLYWNMKWPKEILFLRYLVVACHKLSQFNSRVFILDFTWNSCGLQEAKECTRNPGQSKCVTRETRYHVSIVELLILVINLQNQAAKLVRRPRTTLKILHFSGCHQLIKIQPGVFMTGLENILFIGRGSIIWNWGCSLSIFINQESHQGSSQRGTWTGYLKFTQFCNF